MLAKIQEGVLYYISQQAQHMHLYRKSYKYSKTEFN